MKKDSKPDNHKTETGDKSGTQVPNEVNPDLITHAEMNSNNKNPIDNLKIMIETKLGTESLEEDKSECKTQEKN